MRHPTALDLQIFRSSYFEDEVYGGRQELNIEQFLREQTNSLDRISTLPEADAVVRPMEPTFLEVITPKPQWLRAIIWLLVDFNSFRERLRKNLNRLFGGKKG